MMMVRRIAIGPSSIGLAESAFNLFGINRVDPGDYLFPVYLNVSDMKQEDIDAGLGLLRETFPNLRALYL